MSFDEVIDRGRTDSAKYALPPGESDVIPINTEWSVPWILH